MGRGSSPRYAVSIRIYVRFALLTAVPSTVTSLLLLFLVRPYLASSQAEHAALFLFAGAAGAAVVSALAGLLVGIRFAGRIRGIVEKADGMAAPLGGPRPRVMDEAGALDAAMGRLTLSMDCSVRARNLPARMPEGILVVDFA